MQLSQALAQPQQPSPPQPSQEPVAMEVDQPDSGAQSSTTKTAKKDNDKEKDKDKDKDKEKNTAPPSKAPSPKPARNAKEKDAVPTKLPQGSGLISNALFGMDDNADTEDAQHATPNIILHIPLNSVNNRIVNFARLAEEQYGFAALHPRLAAHKERLARVAAAGAALERNEKSAKGLLSVAGGGESADEDLSLDMDRDSDLDGDIAMAGIGAAANDAPADGTDGKKKRRKKMEEYDRDDPFVDDSEMAWQEHAAASKDGYFVYSGPLVPEGEKVQVERLVFSYCPLPAIYMVLMKTVPMEPSNADEAADAEVAVAHHPAGIKSHWPQPLPQFPSPKKPASLSAVQVLAVAAPPAAPASAKPHASRWKWTATKRKTNWETTPRRDPKAGVGAQPVVVVALEVEGEKRPRHHRPPLPLPPPRQQTMKTPAQPT